MLARSSDLADLGRAWDIVKHRWAEAVERANRLDAADPVTDGWISRTVLGEKATFHPWGLPPSFLPHVPFVDADASPTLDEMLVVRDQRQSTLDGVLERLDQEGLDRMCGRNSEAGYPPDTQVSVLHCLRTVIGEEWAHHGYAVRDLAILEEQAVDR